MKIAYMRAAVFAWGFAVFIYFSLTIFLEKGDCHKSSPNI